MISGMYMGELVRLVIEKLTKEGLLLGGKGSDLLFTRSRFYTKYVSEIESEPPGTYTSCKEILEELGKLNKLLERHSLKSSPLSRTQTRHRAGLHKRQIHLRVYFATGGSFGVGRHSDSAEQDGRTSGDGGN